MPTYEITVRRELSAFDTVLVEAYSEALARKKVSKMHRDGSLPAHASTPTHSNIKSIFSDFQVTHARRVINATIAPEHVDLMA